MLASSVVLLTTITVVLGTWSSDEIDVPILLAGALLFAGVGGVVLDSLPGHKVGRLLAVTGLAIIGSGVVSGMSERWPALEGLAGSFWLGAFALVGLLLLWFPTGDPPTRRWRWLVWLGYWLVASTVVAYTFAGRFCPNGLGHGGYCLRWKDNPIGLDWMPNPEYEADVLFFVPLLVLVLGGLLGLIVRTARSRGHERQQLKWFLAVMAVIVGWVALSGTLSFIPENVSGVIFAMLVAAIPVSLGAAILRYRLYEIDRIISRTLGYALVVGVLASVYAVGAVWLPTRVVGDQVPPVFVAGSTLLVIVLFNPVRRRLLGWVDRRFYRSRYDAVRVSEEFGGRLKDIVDVDRLADDWLGVVTATMQPATAGVWVKR